MVVCVACILAAQISIQNRYHQFPFADLHSEVPELARIQRPPIETNILGAINLVILCVGLAFRRYGKAAVWSTIGAAFVTTATVAAIAAFRYPN
jgi:hypothetical protein